MLPCLKVAGIWDWAVWFCDLITGEKHVAHQCVFFNDWRHFVAHLEPTSLSPQHPTYLPEETVKHTHRLSPATSSAGHFTPNSSRGTDVIISTDKESLLWQLHKEPCILHGGRRMTGCRSAMIRTIFFFFLAHVPCAIRRLILRGRYFRKVAHKQHYRYPSCSRKHVLVSGKALEGEEGGSRLERGRQEIKNKEYNMMGEGGRGCFITSVCKPQKKKKNYINGQYKQKCRMQLEIKQKCKNKVTDLEHFIVLYISQ